ncbi:unnamed protein product [Cunninghamella blakesleeana]
MTIQTGLVKQRSFGLLEKYQASKTLVGCYGLVTCTAILKHETIPRSTSDNDLTNFYLKRFYPAITQLVQKHPFLSMVVNDYKESTAHFNQLSSFSLLKIIHIQEQSESYSLEKEIESACDEELVNDETMTLDIPLWRLKIFVDPNVLDQCTVIFITHHVIMDGKSLTIFWDDLLKFLNDNNNYVDDHDQNWIIDTKPLEPMALPVPFELRELTPKPSLKEYGSLFYKLIGKSILPTLLQKQLGLIKEKWEGDSLVQKEDRHDTKIILGKIVGDDWLKVTRLAKKQYNISVHAVVNAAYLLSWAESYPDINTVTTTPINWRPLINANGEIGNFVGAYDHTWDSNVIQNPPLPSKSTTKVQSDSPHIWRLAAHYNHHLQTNKGRSCIGGQFLGLLKYPKEYCDYWYGFFKDNAFGRSGGLEHSDLGRFDINSHGTFEVESLYFAQSAQTFTTALGLNTISVKDGLYASFTLQKNALDELKARKIMDRFIDILKTIE